MKDSCVLDASAILALVLAEPGESVVREHGENGLVSAVNYSETLAKLFERGVEHSKARSLLDLLDLKLVAFDQPQAEVAARLRSETRTHGLSFADRACLALADSRGLKVLTADRQWASLKLDLEVVLIRPRP